MSSKLQALSLIELMDQIKNENRPALDNGHTAIKKRGRGGKRAGERFSARRLCPRREPRLWAALASVLSRLPFPSLV